MRLRFKLYLMGIAATVFVVSGISILLLRRASGISIDLSLRGIKHLTNHQANHQAEYQAEYWKNREDGYIRVLRALSNIGEGGFNFKAA